MDSEKTFLLHGAVRALCGLVIAEGRNKGVLPLLEEHRVGTAQPPLTLVAHSAGTATRNLAILHGVCVIHFL